MKRLAVLRHAKSSWADPGMADFDRPLNGRGREAARLVGAELAQRGMQFDLIVASTAVRVRETLAGLQDVHALGAEIRDEPRIYEASARILLELVRALPDDAGSVLLVGHNPGLQELLLDLTDRDEDGLRDRVREKYPTAALAIVDLPGEQWSALAPGSGRIADLILPRDLAG